MGRGECKLGILGSASYQQVTSKLERGGSMGVKVEFGGFIGGFGKIFFTKGGIKREKEGFWGWEGERRERGEIGFWVELVMG